MISIEFRHYAITLIFSLLPPFQLMPFFAFASWAGHWYFDSHYWDTSHCFRRHWLFSATAASRLSALAATLPRRQTFRHFAAAAITPLLPLSPIFTPLFSHWFSPFHYAFRLSYIITCWQIFRFLLWWSLFDADCCFRCFHFRDILLSFSTLFAITLILIFSIIFADIFRHYWYVFAFSPLFSLSFLPIFSHIDAERHFH